MKRLTSLIMALLIFSTSSYGNKSKSQNGVTYQDPRDKLQELEKELEDLRLALNVLGNTEKEPIEVIFQRAINHLPEEYQAVDGKVDRNYPMAITSGLMITGLPIMATISLSGNFPAMENMEKYNKHKRLFQKSLGVTVGLIAILLVAFYYSGSDDPDDVRGKLINLSKRIRERVSVLDYQINHLREAVTTNKLIKNSKKTLDNN